jgi:hypothetical protein
VTQCALLRLTFWHGAIIMPRNPLNPRLPPKDKVTGRRQGTRHKAKVKKGHSEAMKLRWQDPEYLAKMAARSIKWKEDQKRNPMKYSRLGIPDGMTRKMVQPLWDQAYGLADRFIQVLKDTGRL